MSTLIAPIAGTIKSRALQGRMVHTLSNGNALVMVNDANTLKVYESADRVTFTLRATLDMTYTPIYITSALFADNSVGLAWTISVNGVISINYVKLTYSNFTFSAIEGMFSANSSYNWINGIPVDLDISDGNVPYAVFVFAQSTNASYVRTATRKSDGTWLQSGDTSYQVGGAPFYQSNQAVSIVALGINSGQRALVWTWEVDGVNGAQNPQEAFESGLRVMTTNYTEATGAISSGAQQRWSIGPSNTVVGSWRKVRLFRNPNANRGDQAIMAVIIGDNGGSKNQCYAHKMGYDGTNFSRAQQGGVGNGASAYFQWSTGETINIVGSNIGMGQNGNLNFYLASSDGSGNIRFGNMTVTWTGQFENGYDVAFGRWWDGADAGNTPTVISAGGWRNANLNKYDTAMLYNANVKHWYAQAPRTLTSFTPTDQATGVSATPDLTGVVTGPITYSQVYMLLNYQFSLDPTFATGVRDYIQDSFGPSFSDPSKTQDNRLDMHFADTQPKNYADRLPSSKALAAGLWYVRARLYDSMQQFGPWVGSGRRISVGHPPSAVNVYPINNRYIEYGNGDLNFSWNFQDTSQTDKQTAYQVRVKRVSDGAILNDTGKVASASTSVTLNIATANKNIDLYWEVRLWDTDDAAGDYSNGSSFFQMVDPASVQITTPTSGSTLATGVPTITGKVVTTGARTVKEWVFVVTSAGKEVWSSKRYFGSLGNNQTMSADIPNGLLVNNSQYTVVIRFVDDAQISNASPPSSFSTSWVSPSGPTTFSADATQYNTDGQGYVAVSWNDTNRETEFTSWIVYRKADITDYATGAVIQEGNLVEVTRVYNTNTSGYQIKDYLAPAGGKVTYVIRQTVNRAGFQLQSENANGPVCYPVTDSYWLIDMLDVVPLVSKLPIVTGDQFTEEQEEAEYTVIGRGRHVDKGEKLGAKGQLDVQIRLGRLGSPRVQRLRLLAIQERNALLYLRNPFGDVMKVNTSSMSVSRIAGVGPLEYCDVSIPYAKVS